MDEQRRFHPPPPRLESAGAQARAFSARSLVKVQPCERREPQEKSDAEEYRLTGSLCLQAMTTLTRTGTMRSRPHRAVATTVQFVVSTLPA